ncbi:MAG TPA: erythromycin esterase family protein [Nitriliruptorales bacterium]
MQAPSGDELTAWCRRAGQPLDRVDPDGGLGDLEPLVEVIGDARVVGLGESAHAMGEFYRLKHRLLRFLVERMGFSTFALESGFAEGLVVDRWVQGGAGDLDDVIRRGFTYNMGSSEEFAAQLTWMREHNLAGRSPRLRYRGTDLPGWLGSARPALDEVVGYLQDVDAPTADRVLARATPLVGRVAGRYQPDAVDRYAVLTGEERDGLTAALADLVATMERRRPDWIATTGTERFELALRCAVNAAQLDAHLRHAVAAGASTAVMEGRDVAMAANIRWMLDTVDRGERVVFGAHNGHVQAVPFLVAGQSVPSTSAGTYLRAALGQDYRPIGTTFASLDGGVETQAASAGTIDAVLAAVGVPLLLVDLRTIGNAPAAAEALGRIRRMRLQGGQVELTVGTAFDALVHVHELHGMHPRALARTDA